MQREYNLDALEYIETREDLSLLFACLEDIQKAHEAQNGDHPAPPPHRGQGSPGRVVEDKPRRVADMKWGDLMDEAFTP